FRRSAEKGKGETQAPRSITPIHQSQGEHPKPMKQRTSVRTLYAIRCRVAPSRTQLPRNDYLIEHPDTGELVPHESLASPWRRRPALRPRAQAQAKADELKRLTGDPWQIEIAPNACPSCSREIEADRVDFCYPRGPKSGTWRAGCNEHDGGCGFEVEGSSYEDAVIKWNRAPAERLELA